jgi:hypothetical protein
MSGELPNPEDGWIGLTQREFTALIASGAVTGVAGCGGDDGGVTDTPGTTDTAGCMVAYHAVPGAFAATDADIGGVWATDYETGERIDGREAVYALETDPDRVDDPMGLNPAPFANRDDAETYVEAVEYLSAEDIVGLDAFDRDLASQYRGRFLDES